MTTPNTEAGLILVKVAENLAYIRGIMRTKEGKKLVMKAIAKNWRNV